MVERVCFQVPDLFLSVGGKKGRNIQKNRYNSNTSLLLCQRNSALLYANGYGSLSLNAVIAF